MAKTASVSKLRVDTPSAERRIGKYAFIASLASGGMAKVYLAVTRGSNDFKKLVVIKEMHPKLASDPAFVEMFMNEARIAGRLNHANVIQTYEVGSEGSRHFLAMEYLDGVPYTRLARQKDRVGVPLVLHVRILLDVLAGLHYAHELTDFDGTPLRVVHRDVSPQNILLTYDGHVKLLDFGIAKAVSSEPDKKGNELKGKVAYMAPEQIAGGEVDRRADVFCVGIQLWEAVAGRRLWDRTAGTSIPHQVLHSEIPDVRTLRPDVPRRLAEICARALARAPDDRYATALDMERDLEEFLEHTGQRVTTRDVGTFIAAKYAADRTQMREVIDKQLRELGDFSVEQSPRIELAHITAPHFSDRPAPSMTPPSALSVPIVAVAPESAPAAEDSTSGVWQKTGKAVPRAVTSSPPRKDQRVVAVGALAVLALGGFVASRVFRTSPPPAHAEAHVDAPALVALPVVVTPTAAPSEPPAPSATVAAFVEVKIKALPPEAVVSIDGEPVAGNPFIGKQPKDDREHMVRVDAPGYEPRIEKIEFSRDFLLAVDLKKLPRGTLAPAPAPAGAPPPNKLQIDLGNPYK